MNISAAPQSAAAARSVTQSTAMSCSVGGHVHLLWLLLFISLITAAARLPVPGIAKLTCICWTHVVLLI
jgi:hypothetical protein